MLTLKRQVIFRKEFEEPLLLALPKAPDPSAFSDAAFFHSLGRPRLVVSQRRLDETDHLHAAGGLIVAFEHVRKDDLADRKLLLVFLRAAARCQRGGNSSVLVFDAANNLSMNLFDEKDNFSAAGYKVSNPRAVHDLLARENNDRFCMYTTKRSSAAKTAMALKRNMKVGPAT